MTSEDEMREGDGTSDAAAGTGLLGGDADDLLWQDTQAPAGSVAASAAAPTTPTVSPGTDAALQAEVAYLSGIAAGGAVASTSFWTANGDIPHKWQNDVSSGVQATAGTGGGTVHYAFDPNSKWSAAEIKSFTGAMALWSAEANISFAPATTLAAADVVITRGSDKGAHTAVAHTTVSGGIGRDEGIDASGDRTNVSIDTSAVSFSQLDSFSTIGGYGVASVVHEIGHLVGLGHGGDYNGTVSPASQQNGVYDSRLWSVMSYIRPDDPTASDYGAYPVSGTSWGTTSDGYYRAPYTPMPLDILAAQSLYGAPTSTPLSGGQVFGFNTNVDASIRDYFDFTVDRDPVVTLFDTGSGNTLDLSGYASGATIDLRAGHFSSFDGLTDNLGIAFGTEIDDVVGTQGRDTIVGNAFANVFTGNGSGDTFTGGGGDDIYRDTSADLAGTTITDFTADDTIDVTNAAGSIAGLFFANGVLSFTVGSTAVSMMLQGLAGGAFTQRADTTGGGGVDIVYDPTAPTPTAPAAPTLALAAGSDTGASSTDGITADTRVTVTGSATTGDTVTVFDDANRDGIEEAGEAVLGTATAAAGAYAVTFALAPGQHSLRAVQADPSTGLVSAASAAAAVTVDTAAPVAAPAALTVAGNAGRTAIGIAAPVDDTTSASQLAVTIGALPGDGTVTLADGTAVATGEVLTVAQLAGLLFAPTPGLFGQTATLGYTVTDLAGNTGSGAATLSIGAPPAAPAVPASPVPASPIPASPASTSPGPTMPATVALTPAAPVDAVSISQTVLSSGDGGFTLSGRASSTVGIAGVAISGVDADGAPVDLGSAALDRDGTFTATIHPDAGGALPGSITAVMTDGAGGRATASAPFTLQAGGSRGVAARQVRFDPASGAQTGTELFRSDGSHVTRVEAGGQVFASDAFDTFRNGGAPDTTFVFQPGYGLDTIAGFRLDGADHDTLSLPASDFTSIADVLRHAHNAAGGVAIVDPASGDTVKIAGITKTQLVGHRAAIALHG